MPQIKPALPVELCLADAKDAVVVEPQVEFPSLATRLLGRLLRHAASMTVQRHCAQRLLRQLLPTLHPLENKHNPS